MSTARAAVIGAAGHAGGEVCRLLLSHPWIEEVVPVANSLSPLSRIHRNLAGSNVEIKTADPRQLDPATLDFAFFCTPTGVAMQHAEHFLDGGCRVIDLSADFRFPAETSFKDAHGLEHCSEHLLPAVQGFPEFQSHAIRNASLVSNPGCYVVAAILGLAPLFTTYPEFTQTPVSMVAVNGTTGAGSEPRRDTAHSQMVGTLLPYDLAGHRHRPEIELRLGEITGSIVDIDLVTMHADFARGILLVASVAVAPGWAHIADRKHLLGLYESFYCDMGAEFVHINREPSDQAMSKCYHIYPSVARLIGSNSCHIGIDVERRRQFVRIVAAIDNLGKGAAGNAIQNMNILLGCEQSAGLQRHGL